MEQTQTPKTTTEDENVSVSVNHCVNTNRTYIYELKNGQIINEKTIHGVWCPLPGAHILFNNNYILHPPWLKDLGFLGTPKGNKCIVGGDAGRSPRVGRELAGDLDVDAAKTLAEKIIQYYRSNGKAGERIGEFIDRIGWEEFRQAMLG